MRRLSRDRTNDQTKTPTHVSDKQLPVIGRGTSRSASEPTRGTSLTESRSDLSRHRGRTESSLSFTVLRQRSALNCQSTATVATHFSNEDGSPEEHLVAQSLDGAFGRVSIHVFNDTTLTRKPWSDLARRFEDHERDLPASLGLARRCHKDLRKCHLSNCSTNKPKRPTPKSPSTNSSSLHCLPDRSPAGLAERAMMRMEHNEPAQLGSARRQDDVDARTPPRSLFFNLRQRPRPTTGSNHSTHPLSYSPSDPCRLLHRSGSRSKPCFP